MYIVKTEGQDSGKGVLVTENWYEAVTDIQAKLATGRVVVEESNTTLGNALVEDMIEDMAEAAHNAWWQAYKDLGYTSRMSAWGEEFMVPFSALTEQGKEFDRVIMRSILETITVGADRQSDALAVVRLEDGRWGAENRIDTSVLTLEDLNEIGDALSIWFKIHWDLIQSHSDTPKAEECHYTAEEIRNMSNEEYKATFFPEPDTD